MVKADYWDVVDAQIIAKTGKPIAHWLNALAKFKAADKKSKHAVAHLRKDRNVPRY